MCTFKITMKHGAKAGESVKFTLPKALFPTDQVHQDFITIPPCVCVCVCVCVRACVCVCVWIPELKPCCSSFSIYPLCSTDQGQWKVTIPQGYCGATTTGT